MDIRHLEYFLEVVRQGSFSKAAVTLHVTQPSISKMIKSLEEELGVTLIYRSAKQVELTDAGQSVLQQAQQIVAMFHNLHVELENVTSVKKGKIRIGLPPIAGSTIFPRVLGEFNRTYPNIQMHLFEAGSKKIELEILEGTLDIGVVCIPPAKSDVFAVCTFLKDPLKLIIHPDHRLAGVQAVDFAALAEESFVLYRDDFSLYDHILEHCRQAGFQPKIICETSQREFMTQMVAANLGVALLPGKICEQLDPTAIRSVEFKNPQIYLQLGLIWRKDRYLSFAARRWLEFTTQLLGVEPVFKSVAAAAALSNADSPA